MMKQRNRKKILEEKFEEKKEIITGESVQETFNVISEIEKSEAQMESVEIKKEENVKQEEGQGIEGIIEKKRDC